MCRMERGSVSKKWEDQLKETQLVLEPLRTLPNYVGPLQHVSSLFWKTKIWAGWSLGASRCMPRVACRWHGLLLLLGCLAWWSMLAHVLYSFFNRGVSESHNTWNVRAYDHEAKTLWDSHKEMGKKLLFKILTSKIINEMHRKIIKSATS